ncbi:hypothetical protein PI87_24240 [Ralstonia sp. A12]|nr:hypothetical protein [Ralstonia sp. A12]KHK49864.1 hypothetical protein PI87_24240 [Ralstonia sp. A12]
MQTGVRVPRGKCRDGKLEVGGACAMHAGVAGGSREYSKIWSGERREFGWQMLGGGRMSLLAQSIIVQHNNGKRKLVTRCRVQVADIHQKRGIQANNDSQFISRAMGRWTHEHSVKLDFSRPSTLTDNAKTE